jgi:hypothetical protein
MRKLALGILFAALSLGAVTPALADGSTICTPLWNSTSGAKSCVEVGQTGPGLGINGLPVVGGVLGASTETKATIASTNVFQPILPATTKRQACTIQNNGTHVMYVFFGAATPADTTTSFQVASGQAIYCGTVSPGVLPDQVLITGTSGDIAVVNSQ